jgi:hypothetical protein
LPICGEGVRDEVRRVRVVGDELDAVPGRVAQERGPCPGGFQAEGRGQLDVSGREQPGVAGDEGRGVRRAVGDVREVGVRTLDQLDLAAVRVGEHRDPAARDDVGAAAEQAVPEQADVAGDRRVEPGHHQRHVLQDQRHPAMLSS